MDVGCGDGRYVRAMARLGWRSVGLEHHPTMLYQARRITRQPLLWADAHALPLGTATVDAVTLWHVLEHLKDPHLALTEARRVLKPQGVVLVEVPNARSWQAHMWGERWLHWDLQRHVWHFSPRTLIRLLEKAGFHVIRWRTVANAPGWTDSWGISRRWSWVFVGVDGMLALVRRGGVLRVLAKAVE